MQLGEICLEFSCLTLSFPYSFISSAEILSISTIDIWNRIALCGTSSPVHCRVLSRTPGFYHKIVRLRNFKNLAEVKTHKESTQLDIFILPVYPAQIPLQLAHHSPAGI